MSSRLTTVVIVCALALLAACSGDGATPTPTASATSLATETSAPTRTPQPTTAPPTPTALFCDAKQDDLDGFEYVGDGNQQRCDDGGFVLDAVPASAGSLAAGDFVPRCFQAAEAGLVLVVGPLCMLDGPSPTFTTDPRPPEVSDQLEDGDLVPLCQVDFTAYPDYPILVGPPCVLGGEGYASITSDPGDIATAADCTAGFTYFELSVTALRDLLEALPADEAVDPTVAAIVAARTALAEAAPERVQRFFESWDNQSPIVMNAAIVEALDALEHNDTPEARESLRTQAQEAIDWYTAGRGC